MKPYPHNKDYLVSKEGRVWSVKTDRFLVPWLTTKGYRTIELYSSPKTMTRTVHRMVLETYIGDRPTNMECRHLDGNKENNHLDNLSWGSVKENREDAKNHCLITGLKFCNSKLTPKEIKNVIRMRKEGIKQKDIASYFNLHQSQISRIISGKRNSWVGEERNAECHQKG